MHIDNVGYIFLSEKPLVSQNTKHIDMRHTFIHDYIEDGTVKLESSRSEKNMADPFTKNLSNGPIESLISMYVNSE